jgi:hypothetical protein
VETVSEPDIHGQAHERYEAAASAMHERLRGISASLEAGIAAEPAQVSGEPLVRIRLVPVEVFGADEEQCRGCGEDVLTGYGLMDAVSAWSDCNRAIGRIYRVEDFEGRDDEGLRGCVTVYVPESEVVKFALPYGTGEPRSGDRCPACHVPYKELPKEHRVNRPTCTGAAP